MSTRLRRATDVLELDPETITAHRPAGRQRTRAVPGPQSDEPARSARIAGLIARGSMETWAECERAVDFIKTARLKTEAFASPGMTFDPAQMRWLYERCFSEGSTVVALRSGERKVGQIAMLRQTVMVNGKAERAAQIVDFFLSPAFRGRENIRKLYDEVGRQFEQQDIRFAIGIPNAKALGINARFFKLMPFQQLPLRMGFALPLASTRDVVSFRLAPDTAMTCAGLFSDYATPRDQNGLPWDAPRLIERLSGPGREYGVHATSDLLLISSPRQSRGIPYTMLSALFTRSGAMSSAGSVGRVVAAACRMWGRPLHAYVGLNSHVPALPGIALPIRMRPSPLLVQVRDFKPSGAPLRLDRFQVLDFDLG